MGQNTRGIWMRVDPCIWKGGCGRMQGELSGPGALRGRERRNQSPSASARLNHAANGVARQPIGGRWGWASKRTLFMEIDANQQQVIGIHRQHMNGGPAD